MLIGSLHFGIMACAVMAAAGSPLLNHIASVFLQLAFLGLCKLKKSVKKRESKKHKNPGPFSKKADRFSAGLTKRKG
jgi:hypothetical protein